MKIPDFRDPNAPRAPFRMGEVPAAGWYNIECTFRHTCPNAPAILRAQGVDVKPGEDALARATAEGWGVELATAETLERLAATFAAVDGAGRGLPLTRDHAGYGSEPDTRAAGWIKALHAEGSHLWAWIELTPWGHELINGGEYVYFSTEYDYAEFERVEGGASPRRLDGCTLTNSPRHTTQYPCTNMQTKNTTMNTNETPAATGEDEKALHAAPKVPATGDAAAQGETAAKAEAGDKPAQNNGQPDEAAEATNTNQGSEEEAQNDDDPDMEGAIIAVAELLGLPEMATPADLLGAVKNLMKSNEELQAALAEANKGTPVGGAATNSVRMRYPRLAALNGSRAPLMGQKPNTTATVRVGNGTRAVNSQAKDRADYCAAAVDKRERSMGRSLTPGEYSATWQQANRDYDLGINR
ncbi:MAG: hypothetical protein IJA81_00225 [Akkermansia sp.]|nr:hypothetical protein [Akkermansia sp.]